MLHPVLMTVPCECIATALERYADAGSFDFAQDDILMGLGGVITRTVRLISELR
jgi:hypothetical protein